MCASQASQKRLMMRDAWTGHSFTRMRFQGKSNAAMAPIGRKTGLEKNSGERTCSKATLHHISFMSMLRSALESLVRLSSLFSLNCLILLYCNSLPSHSFKLPPRCRGMSGRVDGPASQRRVLSRGPYHGLELAIERARGTTNKTTTVTDAIPVPHGQSVAGTR